MDSIADRLDVLRSQIDGIDLELLLLLQKRLQVASEIGALKQEVGLPIVQPSRQEELYSRRKKQGMSLGLDRDFVGHIWQLLHEESVRIQETKQASL